MLPVRKNNRLKNYDYSSAGAYFITICTKNRRKCLGDIAGGNIFTAPRMELSSCGETVKQFLESMPGLDKYVIMPNHIHRILLSKDGDQSVSQRIRAFKGLVTKSCGEALFQRSYYDHVIRGEEDYKEIWRYIEENPQKWRVDELFVG